MRKINLIALTIVLVIIGDNVHRMQNKYGTVNHLTLANIEALAQSEEDGEENYSCTVTVDCGLPLGGSISCTGKVCSRGLDWSKGAYVECDGHKTYC